MSSQRRVQARYTRRVAHVDGQRIRAEREQRGWRREQVAADAGLSVSYLVMIETQYRKPSIDALASVCRVLDPPLDDVIVEDVSAS
jgi:transcriptional regulator with XRE-family HTH domain